MKVIPTTVREDLRAAVALARLPWPEQKAHFIERFAAIRKAYREVFSVGTMAGRREYAAQVGIYLSCVEEMVPEDERWSTMRMEEELTAEMRLGEHISVTRRVCGLLA